MPATINHPTKCLLKLASKLPLLAQPDKTPYSSNCQQTAVTPKKKKKNLYKKVSINSIVSHSDHVPQEVKGEACLTSG